MTLNQKRNQGKGWVWAFKKIRSYQFSITTAFFRATLYLLTGDTGIFGRTDSYTKFRIKR